MSRLEERYRRVLRILPASYRRVWEEDMVTAFLASVHTDDPEDAAYLADYGRPGRREVASVAALAVRLRLGLAGESPRSWTRRGCTASGWSVPPSATSPLGVSAGSIPRRPGRMPWPCSPPAS